MAAAGSVPVIPAAEHEAYKDKVRAWARDQKARIAALEEQVALLEEQASGRDVPPCRACGGQLACPRCSAAGGQYEDDF